MRTSVLITVLALTTASAIATEEVLVEYPNGYRSWQHVKTMLIQPGHPLEDPFGGIHHIYANPKAMQGLQSGRFETGASFAFDLLGYNEDKQTVVETARLRLDVMFYNPEQYTATGGWGFTTFVADSQVERVEQDVAVSCYGCHESTRETNFVYSKYRP